MPRISRRTILKLGTSAVGAAMLAGCDGRRGTQWDVSLPWGPQEYHVLNAQRFAAEVEQATNGSLILNVHPGAVLGIKGPDTLRAVEEGIVDMAEASGFHQVGAEPLLGLESLPYLVDSIDELEVLYDVIRPAVEAAYARHGQRVVYIVPWPNQYFFLDQRIETAAQMRGLKMRTYDKLSTDLVLNLGMTPVQMPTTDVVAALAAGSLDAVMTSTTTAFAQKYWDFLKYSFRTNHTWSCIVESVNLQSLERLTPAERDALMGVARRLEPEFWDIARADDADKLKELEANGMETVIPSPDLLAEMRNQARPVVDAFIAQVPESRALIAEFLARVGRPMVS
ncbi:MAG: TRAP transporter substrate-binding protein [Rhodospirillaceae bacterium]|nr:TRAP transporter substrate-binding protein [Rhodospirillaceae bacterium]